MNRFEVKYDVKLDLDSRNSLKLINDRIRDESLILEFGPANGRFTRHLKLNRNCIVDIVEYNPVSGKDAAQYARYALVGNTEGNIENYIWTEKLCNERYDFIVFADVLEHLYDPVEVLKKCRQFLKKDGAILLSVPNIANNNVILNLLNDEFEYTPTGILDDTHIRFFSYKSLNRIVKNLGYITSYIDYTIGRIGETEINVSDSILSGFDMSIIDQHSFGNIYQLIYELKADNEKAHGVTQEMHFKDVCYVPRGFYSENGIYKEETVIKCADIAAFGEKYKVRFDIAGLCKEGRFRFDPLEGRFCSIKLLDVHTDGVNCEVLYTSTVSYENGRYYFLTIDPILEFSGEFSQATYIELEYELHIVKIYELIKMIGKIEADVKCNATELENIKNSRGYRLFQKFRHVLGVLRDIYD